MFEFAWPWLFAALPLPWLLSRRRSEEDAGEEALRVPFFSNLKTLSGTAVPGRRNRRPWFAWLIWSLLILALARPQWLDDGVELSTSGRDLLIAVDVSGSMRVPDMVLGGQATDRLTMVKSVLTRFLARREGDRIGLVLFGDRAYLQVPLSFDRKTTQYFLNDAEIGIAGANHTAIGDAIGLSVKRLKDRPAQNRVLILLTDGVNNAGALDPQQAARLAAEAGVTVYTIGVGADELLMNDPIFGQRIVNPSEELDEAGLSQIAQLTGGRYFRARDTERLEEIYGLLDELEPVTGDRETFRPALALYPWPLTLALVFWLARFTGLPGRLMRRMR